MQSRSDSPKNIPATTVALFLFCLCMHCVHGQESINVIPPSPTASSLVKHADIPVGLYTGVPAVNVPLYELNGKYLTLPISLSYHAGGVKVEESASWVGLGWSLNAGGVVTRTTRGLRDEAQGGFLSSAGLPISPRVVGFFDEILRGQLDTEPDLFFFSFNGGSGKFYLNKKGDSNTLTGSTIPHKDIRVNAAYAPDLLDSFTIITEDGTRYLFDQRETTISRTYTYDVRNPSYSAPAIVNDNTKASISGWYLSEIRAANGGEVIKFSYVAEKSSYITTKRGRMSISASGVVADRKMSYSEITINGLRLSQIRFDKIGVTVNFLADQIREDLQEVPYDPPKVLREISISHDSSPVPIKRFLFSTSYFANPLADMKSTGQPVAVGEKYLYKRLRLDNVSEWSGDGSEKIPPHKFSYNQIPLPPRNAETQDHWGYYNGPVEVFDSGQYYSGYYMMPAFYGEVDDGADHYALACNSVPQVIPRDDLALLDIDGVNREPNSASMQAGILNEITYPTGGKTTLEYSSHQYGYISTDSVDKYVYQTQIPIAFVDRPWSVNPTENETHEFQFEVAETGLYKVNFSLEFANKDAADFYAGMAYNRNEVLLEGMGLPNPHLRIYWDNSSASEGNIYVTYLHEGDGYAGSYLLTNLSGNGIEAQATVTEADGNGNDYARRIASGFVVVGLRSGIVYKFTAKRQYNASMYCPTGGNVCLQNNNEAWISLDHPIPTNELAYVQKSFPAGGLRVARKTETPGTGTPVVTTYEYEMTDSAFEQTGRSSGCLLSLVDHTNTELMQREEVFPYSDAPEDVSWWDKLVRKFITFEGSCMAVELEVYTLFTIDADYAMPLSTSQGSHISYRQVRVRQTGNGSTITKFLTGFDYPDLYPTTVYSAFDSGDGNTITKSHGLNPEFETQYRNELPQDNLDWRRGFESDKIVLDENNQVKSTEHYDYTFLAKNAVEAMLTYWSKPNGTERGFASVAYHRYKLTSGFVFMNRKQSKVYSSSGILLANTDFYHESLNHILLTRQVQSVSAGKPVDTRYTYAADKPALRGTPSTVFDQIVEKNMLYLPVKTEVFRGPTCIEGKITNYRLDEGNIVPDSEEVLQGQGYVVRLDYLDYDSRGNLLLYSKRGDIPNSFIWDYGGNLPVAAIVNATPDKVGYSSFESDGNGYFTFNPAGRVKSSAAKTGDFQYNLAQGSISRPALPAGSYFLTFWSQATAAVNGGAVTLLNASVPDANGWTLRQYQLLLSVPGAVSISGSTFVDEVRLYPSSSQITTQTFTPQVGMTSQNDASNHPSYYYYDKLGRLDIVKDFAGNIVKAFAYHYADQ